MIMTGKIQSAVSFKGLKIEQSQSTRNALDKIKVKGEMAEVLETIDKKSGKTEVLLKARHHRYQGDGIHYQPEYVDLRLIYTEKPERLLVSAGITIQSSPLDQKKEIRTFLAQAVSAFIRENVSTDAIMKKYSTHGESSGQLPSAPR